MTTKLPLFSIITVTLNNLSGLQNTADNLKMQTCLDYEWMIIDGGSNDGSLQYLQDLKANYISEQDSGIYDAMNKGIERAQGKYYIFLNAGDKLENKHTLEEIKNRLQDMEYDFIYGDSAEEIDQNIHYKKSRPHTKIVQGMFTHHQAMIYNSAVFRELRYDTNYQIAADYALTWKTINISEAVLYLPFPICIFESGGLSQQNVFRGRWEQFQIRKEMDIPFIKNSIFFISQTLLYNFRRLCPRLYWLLKRA